MDPKKINAEKKVNQAHYRRSGRSDKGKVRPQDTKPLPFSPKLYVPLIILGILVVIYAIWNPFNPPAVTIGRKKQKAADFAKLDVSIQAASAYPAKSGGRQVKFVFSHAQVKDPIPIKDNLTIISDHGVLTFKTDDKFVDLSTGSDTVSGTLYGVKTPQDHLAIQIFSDQQKLIKQTPLQPITLPVLIKNLYLQGAYQRSPSDPKVEVGIYLTSNTHYEDNLLWNRANEEAKREESILNVDNGGITASIKNNAIYYRLNPDEVIQATFYNDKLTKKQVITKLHRYVAGEKIPPNYRYPWEIELKDNQYTLIYQDANGTTQRSLLKTTKTGNFESFAQARTIPDPAPPTTTVTPSGANEPSKESTPAAKDQDSPPTSGENVQSTPQKEVQERILALLIKRWPTQLSVSQIKLFTLTPTGSENSGKVTYTYTTNGQVNKIDVMNYTLKNDGTIDYQATSQYSPTNFSGNIFTDVDKNALNLYFNN